MVGGQVVHDMTGVLDHAGTTYTFLPDPLPWVPSGQRGPRCRCRRRRERVHGGVVQHGTAVRRRQRRRRRRHDDAGGVRAPAAQGVAGDQNRDAVARHHRRRRGGDTRPRSRPWPRASMPMRSRPPALTRSMSRTSFEGNDPGGIDVGFLVKTSRVTIDSVTQVGKATIYTPAGTTATCHEEGAPQTALLNDRPPLVLEASVEGPLGHDVERDGDRQSPALAPRNRRPGGRRAGARGSASARRSSWPATSSRVRRRIRPSASSRSATTTRFSSATGSWTSSAPSRARRRPADQVVLPAGSADEPDPPLSDLVTMLSPAEPVLVRASAATPRCWTTCSSTARRARASAGSCTRGTTRTFRNRCAATTRGPSASPITTCRSRTSCSYGAPVVTLLGDATLTVEACRQFTDPGATAFDETLGALNVAVAGCDRSERAGNVYA